MLKKLHTNSGVVAVFISAVLLSFQPSQPSSGASLETLSPTAGRNSSKDAGAKARRLVAAMWVWNAQALLADGAARDQFFEFCGKTGVNRIFLAVLLQGAQSPSGSRVELQQADHYRVFLARAHLDGLRVEALAGSPEWAARKNHADALAAVDAILDFNRTGPGSERFDGIHLDVEPYALVGFSDPPRAARLLREFLQMVSICKRRLRTQPGLTFTCDVPAYFFPAPGPESKKFMVDFNGHHKTVGDQLTDLLDSVTLMDYRNHADGPGGAIQVAIPALRYAAGRGKTILLGLETSAERPSEVYFACRIPRRDFQDRLNASGLEASLFLDGYRLASFTDHSDIFLGLVAPAGEASKPPPEYFRALAHLTGKFGASAGIDVLLDQEDVERVRGALSQDPEWDGFELFKVNDPESSRTIGGFKTIHRMARGTSFYGMGRAAFEAQSRSLGEALQSYPSFAGLAIHHYETYRALLEGFN